MSIEKKIALATLTLGAEQAVSADQINDIFPQSEGAVKGSSSARLVDLDDIQFRLKCGIDLVGAVHEAMVLIFLLGAKVKVS